MNLQHLAEPGGCQAVLLQMSDHGIHLLYVFWLKIAKGQVALGDCSPRAPTDPYVPTLEHTAPHIMRSLGYPMLFR